MLNFRGGGHVQAWNMHAFYSKFGKVTSLDRASSEPGGRADGKLAIRDLIKEAMSVFSAVAGRYMYGNYSPS